MSVLKRHPNFESLSLNDETAISIPGLEIYPDRRKMFSNHQELDLTTKEYDLLCLLVANKGRVLTYEQIYQKIWHEEAHCFHITTRIMTLRCSSSLLMFARISAMAKLLIHPRIAKFSLSILASISMLQLLLHRAFSFSLNLWMES